MIRIFVTLFLFSLIISSCNQAPGDGTNAASKIDSVKLASGLFNLEKFKKLFGQSNSVDSIPFTADTITDKEWEMRKLDSLECNTVWQDSAPPYFKYVYEPDNGLFFYSYQDSFKNFNLVCLQTTIVDGGISFGLFTYSKEGKFIANVEAAAGPGEPGPYQFYKNSIFKKDTLIMLEYHCSPLNDTTDICDSFTRYYLLKSNGSFSHLKSDSILDPRLDSVRINY